MKRVAIVVMFCACLFATSTFAQEQIYKGILAEGDTINKKDKYEDSYTIEVPAGQLLIANFSSKDFDPYLTVITPMGKEVTSDDFLLLSRSQVELISEESAEYKVLVTSTSLSGTYKLKLKIQKGKPSKEFLLNQKAEQLLNQSLTHISQDEFGLALTALNKTLSIQRKLGYHFYEAIFLYYKGQIYQAQDEYEIALQHFEAFLQIIYQEDNLRTKGWEQRVILSIALIYLNQQEDLALKNSQKSLTLAKELGYEENTIESIDNIADILWLQGISYWQNYQYEQALTANDKALILYQQINAKGNEGVAFLLEGRIYSDLGKLDLELQSYKQALKAFRGIKDRAGEEGALNSIASVYYELGQLDEALGTYQQLLEIKREVQDRAGEGSTLNNIAIVYRLKGQLDKALENYQQALEINREVQDKVGEGTSLNGIALVYDTKGQLDRALETYQQALEIRREVRDREGEGITLNNIAAAYETKGQLDKALENLHQALEIMREVQDREGEGTTLNNIAMVYKDKGQLSKALETYQLALGIMREVQDRAHEGFTLSNIAEVYYYQGQIDRSLATYQQALEISREVQNREGEGIALNGIALIYETKGQLDKALETNQQALEIRREIQDRAGEGTTLNNVAVVYKTKGQLDKALENFQLALEIMREVKNRGNEGSALNNIAGIYDSRGQLDKALETYQQALEINREVQDRVGESTTLSNIAGIYQTRDQLGKALEAYQLALEIMRDIKYREGEGAVLSNIALIYHTRGKLDEALETLEQALIISREVQNKSGEGATLHNIAAIYETRGQLDKALETLQQALEIHHQAQNRVMEGTTLNSIAGIYKDRDQLDKTLETLQQTLKITNEVQDNINKVMILSNIGFTHKENSQPELALQNYQEAIFALEKVRSQQITEDTKSVLVNQNVDLYHQAIQLAIELDKKTLAFFTSEQAKSRDFLDQLGNTLPNILQNANPELVAELEEVNQQLNNLENLRRQTNSLFEFSGNITEQASIDPKVYTQQIKELNERYNQLVEEIKRQDPEYASLITVYPLELEEVQDFLKSDQTLISYFLTDEKSFAFIVSRSSLEVVEFTIEATLLENTLQALLASKANANNASSSQQHLIDLYNMLVLPIEARNLLTTKELIIVPHGSLHFVPFAALWDGEQYLGENYQITYLPSASVLRFLEEKQNNNPNQQELLSMAYPAADNLPLLGHAKEESESIAKLYETTALTGIG